MYDEIYLKNPVESEKLRRRRGLNQIDGQGMTSCIKFEISKKKNK